MRGSVLQKSNLTGALIRKSQFESVRNSSGATLPVSWVPESRRPKRYVVPTYWPCRGSYELNNRWERWRGFEFLFDGDAGTVR